MVGAGALPRARPPVWAESVLTLDVDGDRSLLPSRDGFVGGSAHDALPILHVARGDEEGTHDALALAISQQGLREQGEKPPGHSAGVAWAGRGRHDPASAEKKKPSAPDSQGCKCPQTAGGFLAAPWPGRTLGCRGTKELFHHVGKAWTCRLQRKSGCRCPLVSGGASGSAGSTCSR